MKRTKTMVYVESAESRELLICLDNESRLYPHIKAVINMLHKKHIKGNFDKGEAWKAFFPLCNEMAKIYAKRFAHLSEWNTIFSVQCRYTTAIDCVEHFADEIEQGIN